MYEYSHAKEFNQNYWGNCICNQPHATVQAMTGWLRSSTAENKQGVLVDNQLIMGRQCVLTAMNANRTQGCTANDYSPLPSTGEAKPGTLHSVWGPQYEWQNVFCPSDGGGLVPKAYKKSLGELGLLAERKDEAGGCQMSFLRHTVGGSRADGMRLLLEEHSDNIKKTKATRREIPAGDTERNVHKKGGEVMGKVPEWWRIYIAGDCPDLPGHGPEKPAVAVSKGLD